MLTSPPNDTRSGEFAKYDSGFIKPDVDFEAQGVLNQYRHLLIADPFDVSALQKHTLQFKSKRDTKDATNGSDDSAGSDSSTPSLVFDADFESGNIGEVSHFRDCEYDVSIRGDSGNSRHSIWFYFRVRGGTAGQKLICHIHNYSKAKSLFSEGFTPLIRSRSKPLWTRMPESAVSGFKCNRHRRNCFTFSAVFARSGDELFFAYSFPYTYSYLQKVLADIEHLKLPFVKRQLLARTVQQRRVDCLRIEEESDDGDGVPLCGRPCVVFSSRVHPGESPASFVMDGLLEFLLSAHEAAIFLRRSLTILLVPMLNPDGVFAGNYRCTSLGDDLNRHWHHPCFRAHPTICALKALLRQLDAADALDFYLDLHGHTNSTDAFMYCNQAQPSPAQISSISARLQKQKESSENAEAETRSASNSKNNSKNNSIDEPTTRVFQLLDEQQQMAPYYARNNLTTVLPRLLALHCAEYAFSKSKFCNNPKKAGSARRAMEAILGDAPLCYTFEVSFWRSANSNSNSANANASNSSSLPFSAQSRPNLYSQETYRNMGRCMARALADYYKVPKLQRHDLAQYNLKAKRFMKGDLRKKIQKAKRAEAKLKSATAERADTQNASGKINVSMPTVPKI